MGSTNYSDRPSDESKSPTSGGGELTGRYVGRYQVLGLIGTGGMGEVYAGHDPVLQRPVAIKRLHAASDYDATQAKRLHAEGVLTGKLNHENIVQVFDFVLHDAGDFLVCEYVDGPSLREIHGTISLDFERALRVIRDIATGLSHAHSQSIIHRDLKMENVLVGTDGSVKIIDFGLSRLVAGEDSGPPSDSPRTRTGTLVGTYQSMSPEQAEGRTDLDLRSDLFSFGVIIYELFAGDSPFTAPSPLQTLHNIRNRQQRPLLEVAPHVTRDLSELVDRLLQKQRNARPKSAAEVVATLDAMVARRQPSANDAKAPKRGQVALVHLSTTAPNDTGEDESVALMTFHRLASDMAEELGGSTVYAAGAEALIRFGAPRSREEDLRHAGELLGRMLASSRDVRGAIDVGDATVHPHGSSELLLGSPVSGVMALGRLAPPGTALASWRAQIPLTRFFRMVPRQGTSDRGHEAAPLFYEIVEPIRPGTEHLDAPAMLVGRTHELELMRRRWQAAARPSTMSPSGLHAGEGSVLALEGEAGIGKTRLLEAFRALVLGEYGGRRRSQGSSDGTGVREMATEATSLGMYTAFDPFRRLLTSLPELLQPDGSQIVRDELQRRFPDDPEHTAAVAQLCGIATQDDRSLLSRITEAEGPKAVARRIARFVLSLCASTPLLLTVEDLHFMDHASRDVVEELVTHASRLPVFLVATYRPTYKPQWATSPGVTRLSLERLSDIEARALLDRSLRSVELPGALSDALLKRAAGVPLWLEELARSVVERVRRGSAPGDVALTIPATMLELMQSRLQAAPKDAKRTVEIASAIGSDVNLELLRAVLDTSARDLEGDITILEQSGLMRRRGMARTEAAVFPHALMRDAIYETLDPDVKKQVHQRVIATLESRFAPWRETRPELFAQHHEATGNVELAIDFWRESGGRALAQMAFKEAQVLLEHGVELLQRVADPATRATLECSLLEPLGACAMIVEGLGSRAAERIYARLQLLRTESETPPTWGALWQQWAGGYATCNMQLVTASLGLLAERAGDSGPEAPLIRYALACSRGMIFVHLALLPEARAELESALLQRDAIVDVLLAAVEHTPVIVPEVFLAWVELLEGDIDAAWSRQRDIEDAYEPGSVTQLNAMAIGNMFCSASGDYEEALRRARVVIQHGENRLLRGHVDANHLFHDVAELRRLLNTSPSVDAAIARTLLQKLWKHFEAWRAETMKAGSIIYCSLMTDVCVDVLRHETLRGPLEADARDLAHRAVSWGLACIDDPGSDRLHRYCNSELFRVLGRLRAVEGDMVGARTAFDEARRRCALIAVPSKDGDLRGPRVWRDRIDQSAEEA